MKAWARSGLAMVAFVIVSAAACSRPAPAPPVPTADSYTLRIGRETYTHYCRTCHGDAGAGDGFNAYNLDPRPRDLSDPKFQTTHRDADLADAIRRGGAGVGLSPLMPPWGNTLTSRQITDVIAYLRTFRKAP
jgi:mono/diheme cytochrome c family protein